MIVSLERSFGFGEGEWTSEREGGWQRRLLSDLPCSVATVPNPWPMPPPTASPSDSRSHQASYGTLPLTLRSCVHCRRLWPDRPRAGAGVTVACAVDGVYRGMDHVSRTHTSTCNQHALHFTTLHCVAGLGALVRTVPCCLHAARCDAGRSVAQQRGVAWRSVALRGGNGMDVASSRLTAGGTRLDVRARRTAPLRRLADTTDPAQCAALPPPGSSAIPLYPSPSLAQRTNKNSEGGGEERWGGGTAPSGAGSGREERESKRGK